MSVCSLAMLIMLPEIEAEQSFSFLFGVILSEKDRFMKFINKHTIYAGGILFSIGVSFLCIKQIPHIRGMEGTVIYSLIQLILKFSLGLSIILFSWRLFNNRKKYVFLSFMGMISYELYLVHCKMLLIPREYPDIVGIFSFWAISILLSWILYYLDNYISKRLKNYGKTDSIVSSSVFSDKGK